MKRLFIIAVLSIFSFVAGATQQINDKVIIDDQTWEMPSSPLEYLQAETLEAFNALIGERDFISTANYRGYIAYWYVTNSRLYLDRIEVLQKNGKYEALSSKDLKKVFRKYRRFGKIKAGWITGDLHIGKGTGPRNPETPHTPSYAEKKTVVLKKGRIIL